MRIDATQVLGQGGVKIKAGTGVAADALKEGDVVRAGVVSGGKNGNVTLKLETGQSFNAKLGDDLKLSPGDVVLLEVTGKDKGQVSLSFAGVETAEEDLSAPQMNLVKDFSDKSLAPYANKLAELNMPVTEESARIMRELIAQNPGLSRDEAAFLASNKITGDENLMKAALEVIAGGDKTDVMIERLLNLINEQGSVREPAPVFTVSTANASPLTELLTTIVKSFAGVLDVPLQGDTPSTSTTQTIIAHSNTIMQTNADIVDDLLTHGKTDGTGTTEQGIQGNVSGTVSSGPGLAGSPDLIQNINTTVMPETSGTGAVNTGSADVLPTQGNSAVNEGVIPGEQPIPGTQTAGDTQTPVMQNTGDVQASGNPESATNQTPAGSQPGPALPAMSTVVANLLSGIPEFSGTPPTALQRFSEMLMRVAGDNPQAITNTDDLTTQIEKLFTKIGRNDTDAGARLKEARQELYTRLALIEEAISRAAQPARAEILVQTQKLMNHVRLLNSIDQFVYMQMPVQLNEERKTADLYVFKRKGGKRPDQDNINILLAIDLEFMGHWEALVNIKNNKEVSIQMEVPGEAEKDHFNSNTVLLHNMLDEAGFKLVSTNIKFAEEETSPLTALSTFDRFMGGQQGIIDFKI